MRYVHLYPLLMFVFCAPCKGQDNPGRPKDNAKSETKDVITPYGPNHITRNIIQDRKGNIWLATFEGVFRYNGKSFTNITDGVSSARFFSLIEDRQGNLWFGSIGSGVYRYDARLNDEVGQGKSLPTGTAGFQSITTDNGLLNNEITCIYEDKAGNIWFGGGGGVSRYDARLSRHFSGDEVGQGKSLPTGHAGFRNYIINGDSMMEDKTGKTFPNSPRQPYGVNDIMEDKTGKFWIATTGDTFVYDGKNFIVVARNGKPFKNVRTIIEDKKGNIWLSGNDGLWRYDGSTFTNIANNFVGFVYEDRTGTIWTSSGNVTGDWALCRYDEKSLSNKYAAVPEVIKSKEGMIFGILEANDGSIWFGTLNGVNRYDGNTITDFKKAKETK